MKLHLGCGNNILEGFVNIDARELPGVQIVGDICNLSAYFHPETIDLIYASHVLEHIGRLEYMAVLRHWYSLLKEGGVLRLAVPDMEAVVNHYNIHRDLRVLRGFLVGGQTYKENVHYMAFDFDTLEEDLMKVGFKSAQRYNWRITEHADSDDYSQSYLPHMDKKNGLLMSLNVEAKR